jgi:predicted RNA-binding protein with TRAM domain
MENGEIIKVEMLRMTDEGKGLAFHTNGMMVIIDGVNEDDSIVNVQITNILEATIFGNKVGGNKAKQPLEDYDDLKDSPYEMDEGDEDEDED